MVPSGYGELARTVTGADTRRCACASRAQPAGAAQGWRGAPITHPYGRTQPRPRIENRDRSARSSAARRELSRSIRVPRAWIRRLPTWNVRCSQELVFSFPISGARCISALEALGYRMIERCGSCLVLRRPDQKIALVPDCTIVHPVVIEALLAEANVSLDRFMSLLDEPVTVAG